MAKGRVKGSKVTSRTYTASWKANEAGLMKLRAACKAHSMKQTDLLNLLVSSYLDDLTLEQMTAKVEPALKAQRRAQIQAQLAQLEAELAQEG